MDSLTFLQNINSAILSLLNWVLFLELTIACCYGMYQGWTIGEATTGQITELGLYTAMLLGAWQWWPHKLVGVNRAASMCVLGVCWGVNPDGTPAATANSAGADSLSRCPPQAVAAGDESQIFPHL